MRKELKILRTDGVCVFLIVLFHVVGLIGFLVPAFQPLFKQLVPFHLLLMLFLIVRSQKGKNVYFLAFLLICYFAGFFAELAGVQTGLIFGNYAYGATLGYKIAGTPLMIGVNWILVIYSVGMVVDRMGINNAVAAAALGAVLVTILDVIIEPVAVRFDYWSWHGNEIPLQNYMGWLVLAFFLLLSFFKLPFKKGNPAGVVLFVVQFAFFVILLTAN
ncbi:carotenoid biosynthesis protein, partial [Pararcticibacter amylolyticus]